MNIVLTGGGTAGHIMPNLALVDGLKEHFENVFYLGGDGMEAKLVPEAGIPFYRTETVKLNRTKWWENAKIPFILSKSVAQATEILRELQPTVVLCKGGYAALPCSLAARKLKVPVVVHESDYTMGVANKLVSKFAVSVLTSFPETEGGRCIGSPVRESLFHPSPLPFHSQAGYPTILIFGGSLGAEALNNTVAEGLRMLTHKYNVIHITGEKHAVHTVAERYFPLAFSHDMGSLFAAADAVVMRGGAGSLAEGAALGKRILCIPLPKGESRGDQLQNAESYRKRGYARVLPQSESTPERWIAELDDLLSSPPPPPLRNGANAEIIRELVRSAAKRD